MQRKDGRAAWMIALIATALAACDGGPREGPKSRPDAGDAPDAAAPVVEETVYDFATDTFPLEPGQEANPCFFAPFPADEDVAVVRTEIIPADDSHHLTVEYLPPGSAHPDTPGYSPCNETEAIFIGAAQRAPVDQRMPEGAAVFIPRGAWLFLHGHYLNTKTEPSDVLARVVFHTVDPKAVKRWVNVTLGILEDAAIDVPPHGTQTVTARCPAKKDMTVFQLWSHMHQFGKRMTIDLYDETGSVTPIYTSENWEHPPLLDVSASPVKLGIGQGLQWRCEYENTTSNPVVGGGETYNEMCNAAIFHLGDTPEPTEFCVVPAFQP